MTFRILWIGLLMAGALPGGEWFPVRIEAPEYPLLANQSQTQGTVVLRVSFDEGGAVSTVAVQSGTPLLAEAARNNVRLWRFAERENGERAKPRSIEFTYVFVLEGQVDACPKTHFRYEHPFRAIVSSQAVHWMPSKGQGGR